MSLAKIPLLILPLALMAALLVTRAVNATPQPTATPSVTPTTAPMDCTTLTAEAAQQDPDHDGLTNSEECFWGTNQFVADTDGDDYNDSSEVLAGYDPLYKNGVLDSDHDGIPDPIERKIGTDPYNPDTDGDGYPDGSEIAHGYNPLIASPNDKLVDHPLPI